jgi:hypothetical protein
MKINLKKIFLNQCIFEKMIKQNKNQKSEKRDMKEYNKNRAEIESVFLVKKILLEINKI